MPEYIMEGAYEPAFTSLDYFTQAYIEALFWTSEAPGVTTEEFNSTDSDHDHGGSIPGDVGFAELAPAALQEIILDCQMFQESNAADLTLAYEGHHSNGAPYGESSAGHDFWLTRNGHGAGFWDRGLGDVGDRLSTAARVYGTVDVYLGDDELVYLS